MNRIAIMLLLSTLFFSCNKASDKVDVLETGDVISVKIAEATSESINNDIISTGLLTTESEARLAFKIGGIVDKVLVNEGQSFKKGQLLSTLKVTEINAQVDQAKLALEKAKRDYARVDNLYKDSVATLEQWQNAKTGLDLALKAIESISFNQQFASIHAPASGFVTSKMSNEGEVVEPGTPVLSINTTEGNNWILKAGITDSEWTAISVNQKAEVILDAFPKKQFTAFVYRKLMVADQASGSFQIELKIAFNTERPAVGMFGTAKILAGGSNKAITIPHEALIQADGDKAFVFVPQADNSVKKLPIVIQSFTDKLVVIQTGIEAGTKVIVSNTAFLNENSKIAIVQ
jgi:RND family efflux transporter MFP subunit